MFTLSTQPHEINWQQRWLRILLLCAVLAVMVMIFLFSSEDGSQSQHTSDTITLPLIRYIHPGYDAMPQETRTEVYNTVSYFVRKAGHFSEYALLGLVLRLFFQTLPLKRHMRWAWLVGTLYAGTDELHQMFTANRTPLLHDVLIDSAGVVAGVIAGYMLVALINRIHSKKYFSNLVENQQENTN